MKLKNPTILKDAIYNIATDSGACDEYAKGVMVGAVAALCSMGHTFRGALQLVAQLSPAVSVMRPTIRVVPESWVAGYMRAYLQSHDVVEREGI